MLLWFVVLAPVIVAEVFRSPMVDYRLVALGAVVPLAEVVVGQPLALHTLAAPVVVLGVVMVATTGHRLVRRRLLGVPVGMFLHLVLDGTWTDTGLFWWPALGWSIDPAALPEAGSVWPRLLLEAVAGAAGWWAWRRYQLSDPANRQRLINSGHLARGVV